MTPSWDLVGDDGHTNLPNPPDPAAPDPIETIRARAAAATRGPWRWKGNTDHGDIALENPEWVILGSRARERKEGDRGHRLYVDYTIDCRQEDLPTQRSDESDADYETRVEEAARDLARQEYLTDQWGEPATDNRLMLTKGEWATDHVIYEVCPDATSESDPRLYRRDITGMRHPDAVFIAAARTDVDTLLAEVDRLRGERAELLGWLEREVEDGLTKMREAEKRAYFNDFWCHQGRATTAGLALEHLGGTVTRAGTEAGG